MLRAPPLLRDMALQTRTPRAAYERRWECTSPCDEGGGRLWIGLPMQRLATRFQCTCSSRGVRLHTGRGRAARVAPRSRSCSEVTAGLELKVDLTRRFPLEPRVEGVSVIARAVSGRPPPGESVPCAAASRHDVRSLCVVFRQRHH